VFEAEVPKAETAVLVVVIVLDNTSTTAGQIAKAAGEKLCDCECCPENFGTPRE